MCIHLKSTRYGVASHALDIGFLQDQESGIAWIVGIWGQQSGAARAERAIGHQLDAAHGEPIADLGTALQVIAPQRALAADHGVDAHWPLTFGDQSAMGGKVT